MKRSLGVRFLLCLVSLVILTLIACSAKTTPASGLQLLIATNMRTPADLDGLRLEVRQETGPGQWSAPLIARDFRVPEEAPLPTSFAINSGRVGSQKVEIRVVGMKATTPVVFQRIETDVPTDRVAALRIVLAASCYNQLTVDPTGAAQTSCGDQKESCQADTGKCGPSFIASTSLPSYQPGDEDRFNLPIVPPPDAGTDAKPTLSSAKDITRFTVLGQDAKIEGTNISLTLPTGSFVTSLTPTIEITGVSVSPQSGQPQNFSGPVAYTVTAADGTTKSYTVTINVAPSSAKDITQFSINGYPGSIGPNAITLTLPAGTDVTALIPLVAISGASVTPANAAVQDFTNPVTYTVTAGDGSTKSYVVTVNVASVSANDITSFSIANVAGVINGTNISVTLPTGTNLTNLTPTIVINGVSVTPASGTAQDFTLPVNYQVRAANNSLKSYTVIVTVAASDANDITHFSLLGIEGTIAATSITLTVPSGTDLRALVPSIAITGSSLAPASGAAQDFTNPVTYTVTAADGKTKVYTVTVTAAASSAKDITQFTILGVNGVVSGTSIAITLPAGSNRSSLTPTVAITGKTVAPGSGVAQDFTNPVQYTVTADDASTKTYSVTVNIAASSAKDITAFSIQGVAGVISGSNISVTMPSGTNVASLVPSITITGTSVNPPSGVAQSFSSPVTYTVKAGDNSTKAYTVTVNVAASGQNDITAFSIQGVAGVINGQSIAVTVPHGTNVTNLTPSITHNGQSINPGSGIARNFSSSVQYTVTAANGSTKIYTVTVSVAPSSQKDITAFSINGAAGTISGQNIGVTVPHGTTVTSLAPQVTINGQSVSPASGVTKDFTNPVTYTVTAADNTTKAYLVTVTVAPSSTKTISQFTINGIAGVISGQAISVTMPSGTTVKSLSPTIQHNGASVSPGSGVATDFTNPVPYTVTAADQTTLVYTVTVTVAASASKDITAFSITNVAGTIDQTNKTITLTLPSGTDRSSLAPTVTHTGANVSPGSGVLQNFNSPVDYVVTAADGTQSKYRVTVNVASTTCVPSSWKCDSCSDPGNVCIFRCRPDGSGWDENRVCGPYSTHSCTGDSSSAFCCGPEGCEG